jgi:putative methanogenesis marker protein 14
MVRKDRVVKPRSIGVSSLRKGPFYTVASVELGNTTTKCVLVSTNLKTAEIYEIEKEIRMTRDVRPPRSDEKIFGRTLFGVDLTRESVSELVSDTLTTTLERARLDKDRDLHFVVRSTGVTASFASPADVGTMVQALADGCLNAGIPPRKMTASISAENLPPDIQDFTWLRKVYFDGAVASSLPPSNTEIVANEMEGELVSAGLKGAAKSTDIDFRNPVMTMDFGTTLAGRVTDEGFPYARTVGSFAGLAGAIPDALARGSGLVDEQTGCVLDIPSSNRNERLELDSSWEEQAHSIIRVSKVSKSENRFGTVPVDARAAEESGTVLIGVDAGINGSGLDELARLGGKIIESGSTGLLLAVIDGIQAGIVQRILTLIESEGLIHENTSLGLTGRAIISGQKPSLIIENLQLMDGTLWTSKHEVLFVEDGLALGAAVAARCMNSMGTKKNPMGGRKGDKCIMADRMKLQQSGRE